MKKESTSLVSFDRYGVFTLEAPELLEAVSAARLGDHALSINHSCDRPGTIDVHCPGLDINQKCRGNVLCLNGVCGL